MFEKTIAMPLPYEMQWVGEWRQNLLLADRFADGRVFLAGDAVHLMIPTGGLGMNSGVGDAVDLGWKLAGDAPGLGRPGSARVLRDERRPVGAEQRRGLALCLDAAGASGARRSKPASTTARLQARRERARLVALADVEQRKSNEMIGAELGYFYVSPLIASEPGDPPPYDFIEYKPSTLPGVRLPHVWLDGWRRHAGPDRRRLHAAAARRRRARRVRVARGVRRRSARRSRFSTCPIRRRATSTRAISSCCAPTCTSPGAATQRPRHRNASPRWRRDTRHNRIQKRKPHGQEIRHHRRARHRQPHSRQRRHRRLVRPRQRAPSQSTRTATCSPAPARRSGSSRPTSWSSRWRAIRSIPRRPRPRTRPTPSASSTARSTRCGRTSCRWCTTIRRARSRSASPAPS